MGPWPWTEEHERARRRFRDFARREIRPEADRWDREERLPATLAPRLAELGLLAPPGPDAVALGLLHEELGAACSSVRSLLTVHGMVGHAVGAFGSAEQRERWLPRLARGQDLGAFALSEPAVGSDARSVQTTAVRDGSDWVLHGTKKWITAGEIATLFLVLARSGEETVALLVEADRPGLSRRPLRGMLGLRAAMLAQVDLDGCRVPAGNVLARPGFGFPVMTSALDLGRFTVAWGCVGLIRACLEASEAYTRERQQFGQPLASHQLVQRMLTDMITGFRTSRLLALQAAHSRAGAAPTSVVDTLVAKYHASTAAMAAAADAVQLHGANGCSPDHPVARYLRDAKTMEILEGSTEIHQTLIARHARGEVGG